MKDVMSTTLYPATPEMSRDEAAEILQKRKIHHAVVRNASGKFAGLLSSWDIARECALDAKVSNRRPRRPVGHPYINEARERRSSDPRLPREASFRPTRVSSRDIRRVLCEPLTTRSVRPTSAGSGGVEKSRADPLGSRRRGPTTGACGAGTTAHPRTAREVSEEGDAANAGVFLCALSEAQRKTASFAIDRPPVPAPRRTPRPNDETEKGTPPRSPRSPRGSYYFHYSRRRLLSTRIATRVVLTSLSAARPRSPPAARGPRAPGASRPPPPPPPRAAPRRRRSGRSPPRPVTF